VAGAEDEDEDEDEGGLAEDMAEDGPQTARTANGTVHYNP